MYVVVHAADGSMIWAPNCSAYGVTRYRIGPIFPTFFYRQLYGMRYCDLRQETCRFVVSTNAFHRCSHGEKSTATSARDDAGLRAVLLRPCWIVKMQSIVQYGHHLVLVTHRIAIHAESQAADVSMQRTVLDMEHDSMRSGWKTRCMNAVLFIALHGRYDILQAQPHRRYLERTIGHDHQSTLSIKAVCQAELVGVGLVACFDMAQYDQDLHG